MSDSIPSTRSSPQPEKRSAGSGELPLGEAQFAAEVFPAELKEIARRRRSVEPALPPPTARRDGQDRRRHQRSRVPTTDRGLVGLAFSGGGIRSATFNLGIVQALHRFRIFRHVDYLSTVSGGGFIGSCLTSLMSRERPLRRRGRERRAHAFPFDGETPAVVHLRNNSNYLAPRGVLDYLRMFTVLVRGIILNFLVLVPFLLVPCLIATLVYGQRLLDRLEYDDRVARARGYLEAALLADQEVEIVGGAEVQPFLGLLRRHGFVPLKLKPHRLTAALLERNTSYREVTDPLITGLGSRSVPHAFRLGVTPEMVTHRLVNARLLEHHDKIEEIQAVELYLRELEVQLDHESGGEGDDLHGFFTELVAKETFPQAGSSQIRLFMAFVTPATLLHVLNSREMIRDSSRRFPCKISGPGLDFLHGCRFTRRSDERGSRRVSLTQILQAFYDEKLFDRRWLDVHRSPSHDADIGYRWPTEQDHHLELEAAAFALWGSLERGRPIETVAELFAHLEALARKGASDERLPPRVAQLLRQWLGQPLLKELPLERQAALLTALKAARMVVSTGSPATARPTADSAPKIRSRQPLGCEIKTGFDGELRRDLEGCRFGEPALDLMRLPGFLYKQKLYNRGWFELWLQREAPEMRAKSRLAVGWLRSWLEPPYEIHYREDADSREREIESAAAELDLQPGETVHALFKRIDTLRSARRKKTPLIALHASDEQILEQLTMANLVTSPGGQLRTCSVQLLEENGRACVFAEADSYRAVPELLYQLEHYNRTWFEQRFPGEEIDYQREANDIWVSLLSDAEWPKRVTVESLFRFLGEREIIEPNKLKPSFTALDKRQLLVDRRGGTCAFDQLGQCDFNAEAEGYRGALRELYRRGSYLSPEWLADQRSARAQSRINRWYQDVSHRISRFLARNVRPYAEQLLWSPRRLRMPLTGLVAIVGLVWVLLFPLIVLASRQLEKGSTYRREVIERSFSLFMVAIAGAAFFELQPYLIYYWHYRDWSANWSLVGGALSLASVILAGPALSFFKKFGRKIVIAVVSILGPLLPLVIYLAAMNLIIYSELSPTRNGYELDPGWVLALFVVATLVVHLFLLALDPNSTSIHGFYKGRLSDAYLVGKSSTDELVPDLEIPLSEICPDRSSAPYQLVNVALNLQSSGRAGVRDRQSDFFVFSKRYIGGGHSTGYCHTEEMEKVFPDVTLSTAMAVSGAAAAPNMGAFTVGPLVILLALLNIRLGYWVPNPREVRAWRAQRDDRSRAGRALLWLKLLPARLLGRYRIRPAPYLFLRELLSRIDDEGRCVNVSDGGHLENTAIFELLRRRCKFIIAGDAEEDPQMNFAGLANLQRLARLDLGVEIKIKVDALRLHEGKSREHFAVGEIHYPVEGSDTETGYLLYLKASLNGDEDQIVAEYGRRQKRFPHESTADQFFDEGQFEAYRDLGFHVVESALEKLRERGGRGRDMVGWLRGIVTGWGARTGSARKAAAP